MHKGLLERHDTIRPRSLRRRRQHRGDPDRRHDLRRGDVVAVDDEQLREQREVLQLVAVEGRLLRGLDLLLSQHVRPWRAERREMELQATTVDVEQRSHC